MHIAQCQHMNVELDCMEVQNGYDCDICCKKNKNKIDNIVAHKAAQLKITRFRGYSVSQC